MATDIGSDAVNIAKVNWTDQIANPAEPAAGHSIVFFKAGLLYTRSPITGVLTPILNPMTTAGDLILGDTDGVPIRLAKGSDDDVLKVDPATHLPVWDAPAASGAMTRIAQTIVGAGGVASVTFAAIPGTYTDLLLVALARGTKVATSQTLLARFNDDAGNNYDNQIANLSATGHTIVQQFADGAVIIGNITAASAGAGLATGYHVTIPAYANTTFNKAVISETAMKIGTASGEMNLQYHGSFWRSSNAITKILLYPDSDSFAEGSTFTLYGLT